MEEDKDIMASKVFLKVCMGIEDLCADLYYHYSELYKDIPEASQLWRKTALEEEDHRRQFEFALRLMHEIDFEISKDTLKRAFMIQCKLLKLKDHIKDTKIELVTAITKALEMEESLADLHAHTSLTFKDESIQRLFKSLSEADHGHVADMQRYQTMLRLPHCDMHG